MAIEIPKEKWSGTVRQVTLGATQADGGSRSQTITLGGDAALPYLAFEGASSQPARAGLGDAGPQT